MKNLKTINDIEQSYVELTRIYETNKMIEMYKFKYTKFRIEYTMYLKREWYKQGNLEIYRIIYRAIHTAIHIVILRAVYKNIEK